MLRHETMALRFLYHFSDHLYARQRHAVIAELICFVHIVFWLVILIFYWLVNLEQGLYIYLIN